MIGEYDVNDPAFTTLAHSFALKAKNTDKSMTTAVQTKLENDLKKLFNLPNNLVRNKKLDTFEWMNEFLNVTNYAALINALNKVPNVGAYQANDEILQKIRENLKPVRDGNFRIKKIYEGTGKGEYNQIIDEPTCQLLIGFTAALDKFNAKKLTIAHLNAVRAEYKKMENEYNKIVETLRIRLGRAVVKRVDYAKRFVLLERKLNKYELPSRRSEANKQNQDYDFDYLKMLQAVSLELKQMVEALEKALKAVSSTVDQYFERRIFWTEFILNTSLQNAPVKKSGFSIVKAKLSQLSTVNSQKS